MGRTKKTNKKERLFCRWYCATGNAREAAAKAGFSPNPEQQGLELLSRDYVVDELKRGIEQEKELLKIKALKGLERIAFGSISDAVRLLCSDFPPLLDLEDLDLFLISEIKKPKDGSMEIKFFDRLKALEKLMQESNEGSNYALPFYHALNSAAKSINRSVGDDDGI